jgi:ParB/RepB/Spo0J family partition protein
MPAVAPPLDPTLKAARDARSKSKTPKLIARKDETPATEDTAREIWISTKLITIKHNDRTEFDQKSIDTLAASIKERGLDNAITVRDSSDGTGSKWELIAGERRLRACRQLKLERVRVRVIEADDKSADLLRLEENMLREDLNQIERAAGLKRYIELHGESQTAVAKRFGMTQGQLSNLLRLLQLPEFWRNAIAAGQIGHTIVRDVLLPWTHRPAVLEFVENKLLGSAKPIEDIERFDLDGWIQDAIVSLSRSITHRTHHPWETISKEACCFKYDDTKHRKLLDVSEDRAWNLDEWSKLNEPARDKAIEKQKAEKAKAKAQDPAGSFGADKPLKKEKPAFDSFKLKRALTGQLVQEFAAAINPKKQKSTILQVFAFTAVLFPITNAISEDGEFLEESDVIDRLASHREDLPTFAAALLQKWLRSEEARYDVHCAGAIIRLAELLPFDLLHSWKPTEEVLEAYSDDSLIAFAHDHEADHSKPRGELIPELIEKWSAGFVPAEVLQICKRERQ